MSLDKIKIKVRRLTGRLSPSQITDTQIEEYVKDFFAYDFPRNISTDALSSTFEFITEPNVDKYSLEAHDAKNRYFAFRPPLYIGGRKALFFQDKSYFFENFRGLASQFKEVSGNDSPGTYTIKVPNPPLMQYAVLISTIDSGGVALNYKDVPTNRRVGTFVKLNGTDKRGSVDYLKGEIQIAFPNSIPKKEKIRLSCVPYYAGMPQAVLFTENSFVLRPVPDNAYRVVMDANKNPEVLADFPKPLLSQWWQYLAYGAAKKIFEDSQDMEGLQSILAGYKEQEVLVLRRSIEQNRSKRTATIYESPLNNQFYNEFNPW